MTEPTEPRAVRGRRPYLTPAHRLLVSSCNLCMSSSVLAATTATATTHIAWTERTTDILSLGLLDSLNTMTGATRSSSSFNCITITLLLIPTTIIALYFYTAFPTSPESVVISPGLGSLLVQTRSEEEGGKVGERVREIYGEDFWERRVEGMGVRVEGGYVQLPLGRTRYWILGPRDAREQVCLPPPPLLRLLMRTLLQLVLIHGLSVPSIIWTDVAPALAQKGYRVLVYGMPLSSPPPPSPHLSTQQRTRSLQPRIHLSATHNPLHLPLHNPTRSPPPIPRSLLVFRFTQPGGYIHGRRDSCCVCCPVPASGEWACGVVGFCWCPRGTSSVHYNYNCIRDTD